jgi:hypothetical protein
MMWDKRVHTLMLSFVAFAACHREDSAYSALQSRGAVAMGVNQYTSSHRFDPLPDGGRIALERDVDDTAGVVQIRRHLQGIAVAFAQGRFEAPAFVHDRPVPGASVMAARGNAITYRYRDLPRGGEIRITAHDSIIVVAIHEFLAFQRADHRVGMEPKADRR